MCRNIRKLRSEKAKPSDAELRDAALQFVRKISGYSKPSQVNQKAFEEAVDGITGVSRQLFRDLRSARK